MNDNHGPSGPFSFRERGFILGGPYVLVAVVVVVLGLLAGLAYYKNAAARYEAEAALARDQRDRAIQAVKDSEEANKKLRELNASLDAALVERDKRAKELEAAKRRIARELDDLRNTLPQEDKDCLARDLPAPLLSLLRDGPRNPDPR